MDPWVQGVLFVLGFIGWISTLVVLVLIVNSVREWAIIRTIAKYTGTVPDRWPQFREASWEYPDRKEDATHG